MIRRLLIFKRIRSKERGFTFSTGKDELLLDKNFLMKPFTILSDGMILSTIPLRAKFGIKSEYITVTKNGCILMEFIPHEKKEALGEPNMIWKDKKSIALNMKNIGEIIKLTGTFCERNDVSGSKEKSLLTIEKKISDTTFKFSLTNQSETKEPPHDTKNMSVSPVDFELLRSLFQYSMPYLIGWHALSFENFTKEGLS